MKLIFTALLSAITLLVFGQDDPKTASPQSHAPIGVMGDHLHAKGEFMLSYRWMSMQMSGNLSGSDDISSETIATTIPNMFSSMAGMPPTLRVVPSDMQMNMHMIGAMFAPTDGLTLMLMGMFIQKEMDLMTYQGGMGTTELGSFSTHTSGLGDVKLTALIRLLKTENRSLHLNAGLNVPLGSITETGTVLTPMNMSPTVRVPYPMQLGSGSWDFLQGITYSSKMDKVSWGGQLNSTLRLADNAEDYRFGNAFNATAWAAYELAKWISGSLRSEFSSLGQIKGMDANIMLPVQTAHPAFQGGKRLDVGIGANLIGQSGFVQNHRLALEYTLPVYQNLNGPQMKVSSGLTIGWQYAF